MAPRIHRIPLLACLTTLVTVLLPVFYTLYHKTRLPRLSTRESYLRYFPPNPNFTHTPTQFLETALRSSSNGTPPTAAHITSGITNEALLIPHGYKHTDSPINEFCPPMNGEKSACLSLLKDVYIDNLGSAIDASSNTTYELSGGCCSRDWELQLNSTPTISQHNGFKDRVVFVLNGHHASTYHHVFYDVVPRYLMFLRLLEAHPEILVGISESSVTREVLTVLGLDPRRVVVMTGWTFVSVALYAPSVFGHKQIWFQKAERGCADVVHDAVSGMRRTQGRQRGRLVLLERAVSRGISGVCKEQRCVTNFEQLRRRLTEEFKGVLDVVVHKARSSVVEGVQSFSGARVVVGVHGGGFQNVMFCEEGTVVVHIGWGPHYRDFAKSFGLKYYLSEMRNLRRESRGVRVNIEKVVADVVDAARQEGVLR